jgi:hypothetical protein
MVNLNLYKSQISNFRENLDKISNNIEFFLEKTIEVGKSFGGPSVYFHKRALQSQKSDFLGREHLEMIYAVMPSWGMHRMGSRGAKMVDFNTFENEILRNSDLLLKLSSINYRNVDVNEIVNILTKNIHVSTSNSFLVSSSKVVHHILPNLISPIDRNYSIRFIKNKKSNFGNKPININNEEAYCLIFLQGMYDFIDSNENIMSKYLIDISDNENYNFNTNITKIFDNLIMVYVKENRGGLFDYDE